MRTGEFRLALSTRLRWLIRPALLIAADAAITTVAFWVAMLLRFEGYITDPYLTTSSAFALLLVCHRVLAQVLDDAELGDDTTPLAIGNDAHISAPP